MVAAVPSAVAAAWFLGGLRLAIEVSMSGCAISIPMLLWRASLERVLEQRRKPILTEYSLKPWTPR
jgi:hypothetical protein